MTAPAQTHMFEVTVMVTAKVPAHNAGHAINTLCEYIRQGLGPQDARRRHNAMLAHAEATAKNVTIPEKESDAVQGSRKKEGAEEGVG